MQVPIGEISIRLVLILELFIALLLLLILNPFPFVGVLSIIAELFLIEFFLTTKALLVDIARLEKIG